MLGADHAAEDARRRDWRIVGRRVVAARNHDDRIVDAHDPMRGQAALGEDERRARSARAWPARRCRAAAARALRGRDARR
jgi:hypothetical protein